jgi:hypothetical protein
MQAASSELYMSDVEGYNERLASEDETVVATAQQELYDAALGSASGVMDEGVAATLAQQVSSQVVSSGGRPPPEALWDAVYSVDTTGEWRDFGTNHLNLTGQWAHKQQAIAMAPAYDGTATTTAATPDSTPSADTTNIFGRASNMVNSALGAIAPRPIQDMVGLEPSQIWDAWSSWGRESPYG